MRNSKNCALKQGDGNPATVPFFVVTFPCSVAVILEEADSTEVKKYLVMIMEGLKSRL